MGQQVDRRKRERGREGTTEEGKEGDKVKECSETTGPLFPLKELPRHSALVGGLQVRLYKEGSYTTWPANSNQAGLPGSFQTASTKGYSQTLKPCQ